HWGARPSSRRARRGRADYHEGDRGHAGRAEDDVPQDLASAAGAPRQDARGQAVDQDQSPSRLPDRQAAGPGGPRCRGGGAGSRFGGGDGRRERADGYGRRRRPGGTHLTRGRSWAPASRVRGRINPIGGKVFGGRNSAFSARFLRAPTYGSACPP